VPVMHPPSWALHDRIEASTPVIHSCCSMRAMTCWEGRWMRLCRWCRHLLACGPLRQDLIQSPTKVGGRGTWPAARCWKRRALRQRWCLGW
jgi:hypothetical protein